ncbi:hypothetical protein KPH14_008805 [Odynerus spinipes]|uniref:Uncharacterized protein n=1 Tax=Odynerus spinipes TaxID=1348599 RepID=A0AAD9R8H1_9HYME|nr:hypothetical protein KPH14_008805 [Odynerus spinipes]
MHAIYQHRTDNEVPRRLPVVKDNNDNYDDDDDNDDRSVGVTLDAAQSAIQSPLFFLSDPAEDSGMKKDGTSDSPTSGLFK